MTDWRAPLEVYQALVAGRTRKTDSEISLIPTLNLQGIKKCK